MVTSFQHFQANPLKYTLEIRHNFIVPKPQYLKTLTLEPRITNFVVLTSRVMTSIRFDDDFMFKTHKIYDVMPERLLSFEFHAHIVASQLRPQNRFGRSHFRPHLFGSSEHKIHRYFLAWVARDSCAFEESRSCSPSPRPSPTSGEGEKQVVYG